MKRRLNVKKMIFASLSIIISVAFLVSWYHYYQETKMTFDPELYAKALTEVDYDRAYAMLAPEAKEKISLADFTQKYEDTFSTIGLTEMRIENIAKEQKGVNQYLSCEIIYATKDYGELKGSFKLPLTEDGKSLIWSPSCIFNQMEDGDYIQITRSLGKRGEIFSADGTLLVGNGYAVSIYATPDKIPNRDAFAAQLAPLIAVEEQTIKEQLDSKEAKRDGLVVLNTYLPHEYDNQLTEKVQAIEGAAVDDSRLTPIRYYPEYVNGFNLAHTLGYTSSATKEDLERDPTIRQGDLVGNQGIEQTYDSYLRPKLGFELYISASDKRKKATLYQVAPTDGMDIHLTINYDWQKRAEESMKLNMLDDQKGCVIVMDGKTGKVEVMASYPTFDPYLFSKTLTQETWDALNDAKNGQPLFNRAISGLYPPGSTVKPFTGAIALDTGTINPNYVFTGTVTENKWKPTDRTWIWPAISRYKNYGVTMNMENSIAYSDNIYFADVAMKTGYEKFFSGMEKLGFTSSVPFDLPTSSSRLINDGSEMNDKLLADTGYGQGEFLTSPLQLATSYTVFFNEGTLLKPQLVSGIYQTSGNQYISVQEFSPSSWQEHAISAQSTKLMDEALKQTTLKGTGQALYIKDFFLHGKTGTAEVGKDKETEISWYVGYAPAQDKIVLGMIECNPKEGNAVKNHVLKDVIYAILGKGMQEKLTTIQKGTAD